MLRSAAKLGFFGALAYGIGKAFYSLFTLLVIVLGLTVLAGSAALWLLFMTSNGFL